MSYRSRLFFVIVAWVAVFPLTSRAHPGHTTEAAVAEGNVKAAKDMADAANNFWTALTPEQQTTAGYKFEDEQRFDWHFVPKARKGLTIKDMTPAQRNLAHAFLSSGLSQKGYAEAVTIMSLEQVLHDIEKKGPVRDPELYYFTIFGKPGAKDPWGWRVEGHHVSLNFTIVDGQAIAAGPAFLGANPAEVRDGPRKGLRVLGAEEDMGRDLIKSLNDQQRTTAIFSQTAPTEIITSNARKAMIKESVGIAYAQLNDVQKKKLIDLVHEYTDRMRGEIADEDLLRITASGWDKVKFAWAGGIEPGAAHYYRVQGPTFLIEYDNTQNNANHVHTVWRDLTRDFGEDLLGKHYQEHPHGEATKSSALEAAHDNTPPEGFVALFNGKDLSGWKGLLKGPLDNPAKRANLTPEQRKAAQDEADSNMRAHWSAVDGVITYDGKGRSLCTAKDYADFQMMVDWKIEPGGDSGIYLRGSPQVQIWDPKARVSNGVGSGGLYNNQKNPKDPTVMADHPAGEWNHFDITMVGDKVTVLLNGKLVVDHVTLENYWERDKPIYPTGQIELQNHSSQLWFKNVYIREIPRKE